MATTGIASSADRGSTRRLCIKRRQEFADEAAIELGWQPQEVALTPLSFREFVDRVYPKYKWYKHCEVLANVLQRIADGELKRVMIFMPPRHGKSLLASKIFPAYFLYRYPERWVGLNSYAAELAYTFSRASREHYQSTGGSLRGDAAAVKHWETVGGGGCWAAGVGGSITGKGFSCFPAETTVLTRLGWVDIGTLFRLKYRTDVLSSNHETGQCEWKPIVATMRRHIKARLVEITTASGRAVRSTSDHLFYIQGCGYRQASELKPGDNLISIEVSEQQNLPGLQSAKRRQRHHLQRLLPVSSAINRHNPQVRLLPKKLSTTPLPATESFSAELQGHVLFDSMFSEASCSQESSRSPVFDVQPAHFDEQDQRVCWGDASPQQHSRQHSRQHSQKVLLSSLSKKESGRTRGRFAAAHRQILSCLRQSFCSLRFASSLLFSFLCGPGPLTPHERAWQFTLQVWNQLCQVFSRDARTHSRARRKLLRDLRQSDGDGDNSYGSSQNESGRPSYRSRSDQQSSGEFGHTLRHLPCGSPQIHSDSVSLVRELCDQEITVYDIEVEGNHNFFAEGLLVHNCGMIDDPLKNQEEAFSDRIREKQKEWYGSTFYTRAEDEAAIVLTMTRWHEDDLAGWLLTQEAVDDEPEGWHIVNFEAIKEAEAQKFPATCTVEPDWRQPGEALCPERFWLKKLAKICKRIGEYFWNALYMQRPSSLEGDIFKRDWWQHYAVPPANFDQIIQSWDCAFKETASSSYVVGQVWGKRGGEFWLLDQVRDRMDINGTLDAIRSLSAKWPNASAILIEDKANGPAVISMLSREIPGILAIEPEGGKLVRAVAVAPYFQSRNVWLPEPGLASWIHDYKEEFGKFPNGANNDQVDATSQALNWLQANSMGGWHIGTTQW